jgi:hypothetical protein
MKLLEKNMIFNIYFIILIENHGFLFKHNKIFSVSNLEKVFSNRIKFTIFNFAYRTF